MLKHSGRIAVAIIAAALTAGCASAPVGPRWEGTPAAGEQIILTVDNRMFLDVVVYSETPGSKVRLGAVASGFNRTFKIPQHQQLSSNLTFVADPVGSRQTYASDPVAAAPGTEIRWTVHENGGVRTLTVW